MPAVCSPCIQLRLHTLVAPGLGRASSACLPARLLCPWCSPDLASSYEGSLAPGGNGVVEPVHWFVDLQAPLQASLSTAACFGVGAHSGAATAHASCCMHPTAGGYCAVDRGGQGNAQRLGLRGIRRPHRAGQQACGGACSLSCVCRFSPPSLAAPPTASQTPVHPIRPCLPDNFTATVPRAMPPVTPAERPRRGAQGAGGCGSGRRAGAVCCGVHRGALRGPHEPVSRPGLHVW